MISRIELARIARKSSHRIARQIEVRHLRLLCSLAFAVAVSMAAGSALAAVVQMEDVKCMDKTFGKMVFDKYEVGETGTGTGADPFRGFVEINGNFVPGPMAAGMTFHYIQAVIKDDKPLKFTDGTAITIPYVDTPPGGYQGDPFDFKPYYDEGTFPNFFDKPTIFLNFTKDQADKQRELEFETWIVCVIKETFGAQANKASDDTYRVAPLLGWKWGFEQVYKDVAPLGTDGLEDITQNIVPFAFLATPTAGWTAALGKVYGTAPNQDQFNITIGDCSECTPEPATAILIVHVASVMMIFARRRAA